MDCLLFLNFYSGDMLSEGFDWGNEVIKALITAIFSGVVVAGGIIFQRFREKKKAEKDLRLLLYNVHVHLNHILQGVAPIPGEYNEFIEEISQKRLDSSVAHRPRRQIPPIDRLLNMDLERVFQSFLITYTNEKQATLDFNNTFTMVEYLNRILEKLGNEYEDSMNIRFSEMQKFSDILMEIQRQLRYLGLLLKIDVSALLNRAIETESTDLTDYLNKFIFYVVGFISKYEKRMEILQIEDEIKKLNESVKVIELRTAELENMLIQNIPEITTAISNITTLNSRIKTALEKHMNLT